MCSGPAFWVGLLFSASRKIPFLGRTCDSNTLRCN